MPPTAPSAEVTASFGPGGATRGVKMEGAGYAGGGDAAGGAEQKDYQHVTYEDASVYIGQINNGKRHGHGIWKARTGQYEGQWLNDQQHGKGQQQWSDGRVYDGQFVDGKFAGNGRMVWHTAKGVLIYEGEYKDDLKHGQGKFIWADNRTYDGQWDKGLRHGKGMYQNARGEKKYGYWAYDKFDRWDSDEKQPQP